MSYLRVSTARQGHSGLGLEAQRAAIALFAESEGFEIIEAFIEVESGKGSDALERRPQLANALARAKRAKCAVVVAKLDRLSRNVAFIASLMSRRVLPGADPRQWLLAAFITELRSVRPQNLAHDLPRNP